MCARIPPCANPAERSAAGGGGDGPTLVVEPAAGVVGRVRLWRPPLRLGSRNMACGRDLGTLTVGVVPSSLVLLLLLLAGPSSSRHWLRKGSWKCLSISPGGGARDDVNGAVPRMYARRTSWEMSSPRWRDSSMRRRSPEDRGFQESWVRRSLGQMHVFQTGLTRSWRMRL